MDLQQILDILGSKGGQTVTNAVGAGLSAAGQASRDKQQMNQNANQFAAQMAQQQLEAQQGDERARAAGVVSARPLGDTEDYIQRQLMTRAILGNITPFSATSGDAGVRKATGTVNSGVDFNAIRDMANRAYTDDSIMRAVSQRDKDILNLSPYSAATDLSGFGSLGQTYGSDINNYQLDAQQRMAEPRMSASEKIQAALDRDLKAAEKKKGSPWWKKALGLASFAIPFVGPAIGLGALGTTLAASGLGAASGAAGGGGVGGALMGGATGALGAKALPGVLKPNPAKAIAKNVGKGGFVGGGYI